MKRLVPALYAVAIAALAIGIYDADSLDPVYAAPSGFTIERRLDDDGNDRVYLDVVGTKLRSCDLESGNGPMWVEFNDPDDAGVPPVSPLFRPDQTRAGKTMADAGETFSLRGYSAMVPRKFSAIEADKARVRIKDPIWEARDRDGSWTINVPCQLWTLDDAGNRIWGRKVVAKFGPLPLPRKGARIVDTSRGLKNQTPLFKAKEAGE